MLYFARESPAMPFHTAPNTPDVLVGVLDRLQAAGIAALVSGGWAEELRGLVSPRPHGDIDLLYPALSFAAVERFIRTEAGVEEIRGKRFAHKRAFVTAGVAVEVTLVESDGEGPFTRFWGDVLFRWLPPLGGPVPVAQRSLPVVSPANLVRYRALHAATEPWRWRDAASRVG
jgi:hypothetical protein